MKENQKYRTIIFFKDYFLKFFINQNDKVKNKFIWTFNLIEGLCIVPENYLKHIESTNGLYEIRVQSGSNSYRFFCFFDKENIVVITSAFQKKTQRIPSNEIEKQLK